MERAGRRIRNAIGGAIAAGALMLGACADDDADGTAATTAAGRDTAAGATVGAPTAGAAAAGTTRQRQPGASVSGRFIDAQGRDVGQVTLEEGSEGVFIHGEISGLGEGPHGFHLHETASCEPPFESAGSHFNPGGRQHGLINPSGPHAGDLTNLMAGADGTARIEAFAPLVTLGSGSDGLLGGDGTALVVHAGPDDHRTDPSGDSGERVACAVLRR